MEAWTPKQVKDHSQYTRVSMRENVTLYIYKTPGQKDGRLVTDVYFYGPHHAKRAEVYAALTGGKISPGNPAKASKGTDTATTVTVRGNKVA